MDNRPAAAAITIAVIAFDGISPFHLSVPCLVFGEQRGGPDMPAFEVLVCGAERGPLSTSAGFRIATRLGLRSLERADIVIMPTWHNDCRPAPPALLNALKRAHRRGARVVGLCLGAFVLAQAGLLDGKRASTHWYYTSLLAERYPTVSVDRDVLYVDEGNVLTSAGVAAGIDCCLHLLRQLCGAGVANRVARRLVVAPHRQGGQAQFIEQPLPASGSGDRFSRVLEWAARNLDQPHDIDSLAARAAMSRRSFTRHFRRHTGTTVKQWLLNQRLARAQSALESGDLPMEAVARHAGFGSALSLRQHFQAGFKTSPSAYRKQFRQVPG
ncbi:MAG: helix-turn-helix domain-containing protein [Burkholderiaceae bacterium]